MGHPAGVKQDRRKLEQRRWRAVITSPAFLVLTAGKTFPHPTHRPNQLWQTAFTYLHVVAWGWSYLPTVLDDFSRYILAWTLRTSMTATDVIETLELARGAAGVDHVPVVHRPRLLSDNGPCYISGQLATYLETQGLLAHSREAPYHPMTQRKIERKRDNLQTPQLAAIHSEVSLTRSSEWSQLL